MSNYILRTVIKLNPSLIKVFVKNNIVNIEGKFGLSSLNISSLIELEVCTTSLILKSKNKSFLNLYTSLIKSQIKGVIQGFKEKIYLKGLGYKFILSTNILSLKIGFSHDVIIKIPKSIKLFVSNKSTQLTLISSNHRELTQFVHFIRQFKKPEPYKGKGIFLKNEKIKRKEGKKKK